MKKQQSNMVALVVAAAGILLAQGAVSPTWAQRMGRMGAVKPATPIKAIPGGLGAVSMGSTLVSPTRGSAFVPLPTLRSPAHPVQPLLSAEIAQGGAAESVPTPDPRFAQEALQDAVVQIEQQPSGETAAISEALDTLYEKVGKPDSGSGATGSGNGIDGNQGINADNLPGRYVLRVAVEGPYMIAEAIIQPGGAFTLQIANISNVGPVLQGTWVLENNNALFVGTLEVPQGEAATIKIDLAGVNPEELITGRVVMVQSSHLNNQKVPFKLMKTDTPVFESTPSGQSGPAASNGVSVPSPVTGNNLPGQYVARLLEEGNGLDVAIIIKANLTYRLRVGHRAGGFPPYSRVSPWFSGTWTFEQGKFNGTHSTPEGDVNMVIDLSEVSRKKLEDKQGAVVRIKNSRFGGQPLSSLYKLVEIKGPSFP